MRSLTSLRRSAAAFMWSLSLPDPLAGGTQARNRQEAASPQALAGFFGSSPRFPSVRSRNSQSAKVARRQPLRVVRCLPSSAGVRVRDAAARAGVVQASREETAACPGDFPGRLDRYGDSTVRDAAGCCDRIASAVGAIARRLVGDGARLGSGMTQRMRNDVTLA
jgi:hypothetical protein